MWIVFLLAALCGPALVFYLATQGKRLRERAGTPMATLEAWPSVGLVIPCAGSHPDMERALRSQLTQNYPGRLKFALVTASGSEPAAELVGRIVDEYKDELDIAHVVAGRAERSGQKNFNSIAAVNALGESVDIYAFCDSTHLASPDFVARLVEPLARNEADFATGYHEVVPKDNELVTLAYAFAVLAMRLMQGLSKFIQPWGGAMCCRRSTFEKTGIAEHWADNVVDDCSLVSFLREKGVKVALSPAALLRTRAEHHHYDVWSAWLDRQILFLKFCVRPQWWLLGLVVLFMAVMPTICFIGFFGSLFGLFGFGTFFASGVYLLATAVALSAIRPLLPRHVPLIRWMGAFWVTCFCAAGIWLKTLTATGILWHGIWYEVGPNGKVWQITRP